MFEIYRELFELQLETNFLYGLLSQYEKILDDSKLDFFKERNFSFSVKKIIFKKRVRDFVDGVKGISGKIDTPYLNYEHFLASRGLIIINTL